MAEEHVEVIGAGFVVLPDGTGVPGIFGNQKITKAGEVVQVGAPAPDAQPVEQPTPTPTRRS